MERKTAAREPARVRFARLRAEMTFLLPPPSHLIQSARARVCVCALACLHHWRRVEEYDQLSARALAHARERVFFFSGVHVYSRRTLRRARTHKCDRYGFRNSLCSGIFFSVVKAWELLLQHKECREAVCSTKVMIGGTRTLELFWVNSQTNFISTCIIETGVGRLILFQDVIYMHLFVSGERDKSLFMRFIFLLTLYFGCSLAKLHFAFLWWLFAAQPFSFMGLSKIWLIFMSIEECAKSTLLAIFQSILVPEMDMWCPRQWLVAAESTYRVSSKGCALLTPHPASSLASTVPVWYAWKKLLTIPCYSRGLHEPGDKSHNVGCCNSLLSVIKTDISTQFPFSAWCERRSLWSRARESSNFGHSYPFLWFRWFGAWSQSSVCRTRRTCMCRCRAAAWGQFRMTEATAKAKSPEQRENVHGLDHVGHDARRPSLPPNWPRTGGTRAAEIAEKKVSLHRSAELSSVAGHRGYVAFMPQSSASP